MNAFSQGAGALAMYDAYSFHMCHIGVVQIFIDPGNRVIHGRADHVDLGGYVGCPAQIQFAGFHRAGLFGVAFGLCLCAGQITETHFAPHDAALYLYIAVFVGSREDHTVYLHGDDVHRSTGGGFLCREDLRSAHFLRFLFLAVLHRLAVDRFVLFGEPFTYVLAFLLHGLDLHLAALLIEYTDGLIGHILGILQDILCFFAGVF